MELSQTLTDDYVICYRITREAERIKLRLWEPAQPSQRQNNSNKPYLYVANFSFSHRHAAEACLRHHLLVNGAINVPESDFPEEGQVIILPYPTWGIETSPPQFSGDFPQ
ncbi:MAG: hypothetical protein AAGE59_03230 [Cyanobacteria bacterium P01_F01_bin.86]